MMEVPSSIQKNLDMPDATSSSGRARNIDAGQPHLGEDSPSFARSRATRLAQSASLVALVMSGVVRPRPPRGQFPLATTSGAPRTVLQEVQGISRTLLGVRLGQRLLHSDT